ncbi:aminoacyl-tRNA deacylase [Archaeoglobales archaeon]|nr:MAG: aminoacyl-tRNA deacylase [Archaeoglobales archaeon]
METKDYRWLERYMAENGIKGEIIKAPDVPTVEKAAKRLNCSKKQIFKSIVFISEKGEGVIGIVDGESRVDKDKLESIYGGKLRIADRDEVLRLTGFSAGGVAAFGTGCMVLVDKNVMNQSVIYGGGGDENHLLKIDPKELLKEAKIVDIRKD